VIGSLISIFFSKIYKLFVWLSLSPLQNATILNKPDWCMVLCIWENNNEKLSSTKQESRITRCCGIWRIYHVQNKIPQNELKNNTKISCYHFCSGEVIWYEILSPLLHSLYDDSNVKVHFPSNVMFSHTNCGYIRMWRSSHYKCKAECE